MAIFEKEAKDTKSYIALLSVSGDMIAIINPVSKLAPQVLIEALEAKGLNVELRESQPEITKLEL